MIINTIHKPNHFLNKLIHLKDFNYCIIYFSQIPKPNDYSFNVVIRALTTTWKRFDLALEFYFKMRFLGVKPDNFTYPFLFMSCGSLLALKFGGLGHCLVVKSGLFSDFYVVNSLITMYSRFRELGFARKVFDEMEVRDRVSWTSMISGYCKMGFAKEARELFAEMRNEGFQPDEMCLVSVLGACGDLGDLSLGRWIESYVVDNNIGLNSFMGSSLIDMYGKCGDLASARRIFESIEKKNEVIWNAMISGYAQNGLSNESISLFSAMKEAGVKPNEITLVVVLSACASIGALDIGTQIEEYALEAELQKDVYVSTALVDMYAKCGSLDQAFRVFYAMPQKNEVSWNAMISALAFHGRSHEALSLFDSMLKEGQRVRPNDITFIGVLSACVHVGLVDEGRWLFNNMRFTFGLIPKIEHYSCMVDLLSRAGLVYEAWEFIEKMPEKPDEVLLGSLLGACHRLKNIDVGERVIKLLLELEPSNSGNYIISSNIYANANQWNDSARMKMLMRDKGVMKTPGCSWIENDAQLTEFHAGDFVNQDYLGIKGILNILYEDMKEFDTRDANLLC
ncbi:hypothetical protein Leryth_006706 [Lithospermum erythrorhizon]|nr:hypothetical protein Leryth_006706 [Lithospermum erythrorhizon]